MSNQNEIVLYRPDETLSLDVRVAEDTVWLNRQQMAELFGRDVKTIGKHINNALKEELAVGANFATTPSATGANFATVQMEGDRQVVRAEGVETVIYTGGVGRGLTTIRDLHNEQSGHEPIEIYKWRVESHDRWLIVDDVLFHCGPSVKDAGRKIGAITRMGINPEVIMAEMR